MEKGRTIVPIGTVSQEVSRALYVGPAYGANELCDIMSGHIGQVEVAYQTDVNKAIQLVQQHRYNVILVDRRDGNLAAELIVPLFVALPWRPKIVVISPLSKVSDYLCIPGVASVLTAPIRPGQLWRSLGVDPPKRSVGSMAPTHEQAVPETSVKSSKPPRKPLFQALSDRFMNIVSTLYKRLAFVLLFALFIAFTFYGVLIGFFLLSSGWAAPMTLTRGHVLVDKVEAEISSLKVQINQAEQHQSDIALAKATATRELADADGLVKYVAGTVKKEAVARQRQIRIADQNFRRLERIRGKLAAELQGKGPVSNLNDLYSKRLITKNYYEAGNFSLLEANQRLATIENDISNLTAQKEDLQGSMEMLDTLEAALKRGDDTAGIAAGGGDLLLLEKQAVDALAARSVAKAQLASAVTGETNIAQSIAVLHQQLAATQSTALARAIGKRVDVLFVPYGNEKMFLKGTPLYTCRATIFLCSLAGHAGSVLPGEVTGVHPFFGKTIRGFFVEVELEDKAAATREIIHGYRKPFFF